MQRCSSLLNRRGASARAICSTVATHHFGGGTRIEKSYEGLQCRAQRYSFCLPLPPPFQRSCSSMYRAPRFERGGCRRESCRGCQSTGMWLNPNSRWSRLRIWQPWGALLFAKRTSLLGKLTRKTWEVHSLHANHLRSGHSESRPGARLGQAQDLPLHFHDGYFSFVKTLSPPLRFTVIWFFAASNVKTAAPSIWNLSSAVASRGTADDAPGG